MNTGIGGAACHFYSYRLRHGVTAIKNSVCLFNATKLEEYHVEK